MCIRDSFLAALFVAAFGAAVVLLALDQQRVIEATSRLQEQTVPELSLIHISEPTRPY